MFPIGGVADIFGTQLQPPLSQAQYSHRSAHPVPQPPPPGPPGPSVSTTGGWGGGLLVGIVGVGVAQTHAPLIQFWPWKQQSCWPCKLIQEKVPSGHA